MGAKTAKPLNTFGEELINSDISEGHTNVQDIIAEYPEIEGLAELNFDEESFYYE